MPSRYPSVSVNAKSIPVSVCQCQVDTRQCLSMPSRYPSVSVNAKSIPVSVCQCQVDTRQCLSMLVSTSLSHDLLVDYQRSDFTILDPTTITNPIVHTPPAAQPPSPPSPYSTAWGIPQNNLLKLFPQT